MKPAFFLLLALLAGAPVSAQEKKSPEARLRYAKILLSNRAVTEAEAELEAASKDLSRQNPLRLVYHLLRAEAHIERRDFPAAESSFAEGARLAEDLKLPQPAVADAYAGLSYCLLRRGRLDLAKAAAEKGLTKNPLPPTDQRLRYLLGRVKNEKEPGGPAIVRRIVFTGNRTDEDVLRAHLPFQEGDPLPPGSLLTARDSLYAMSMFKKVVISSAPAYDQGAEIMIDVEDGWYLIPLPLISAGSGGGSGGGYVIERNYFKRAEALSLLGLIGKSGKYGAFTSEWGNVTFEMAFGRRNYLERQYEDGGYSAIGGLGEPLDKDRNGHFVNVASSITKVVITSDVSLTFPLVNDEWGLPRLSAEVGWSKDVVRYQKVGPIMPTDDGHQGQILAALRFLVGRRESADDDLGAILGYGLGDLDTRVKTLPGTRFTMNGRVAFNIGEQFTGSRVGYDMIRVRVQPAISWGRHQKLVLTAAGGTGIGLPANRLLATGEGTGFTGTYSREYRGDTVLGAGLNYTHPFRESRLGILQGTLFMDGGRA
jgi:tetratricopeptide (TPR) repeat protein